MVVDGLVQRSSEERLRNAADAMILTTAACFVVGNVLGLTNSRRFEKEGNS